MSNLRIGLIGAGFIGVSHVNAIESILDSGLIDGEFVSVCDLDAERAKAIADAFGARTHCSDPLALIGSGDINTVFICTPTKSHPELVEAAAKQGLNMLCEKPLARSLAEAKQMHSAVTIAGVRNQVGLVLRYSPVFHTIKRLISDKSMGRPMSVVFRDDQYFPIQGIYGSSWRGDIEVAGGGTLIEHSIHDVDIMRWLFGEPVRVCSSIKFFSGREGVEDMVAAQIEFQSGCIAQLTSIWHNMLGRESNRFIEIFMENGYVATDEDFIGPVRYQTRRGDINIISGEDVLREYLSAAGIDDPKFNAIHSMQGLQNYEFLKSLEDGVAPSPDIGVALKAHEIVESIYESARSNSPIEISL